MPLRQLLWEALDPQTSPSFSFWDGIGIQTIFSHLLQGCKATLTGILTEEKVSYEKKL